MTNYQKLSAEQSVDPDKQIQCKSVMVPIVALNNWNPMLVEVFGKPIKKYEIDRAIATNNLLNEPLSKPSTKFRKRRDHIARIAYMVVNPDTTPIEIDVGIPCLNYINDWPIVDGHHRLASTFYRGDTEISAFISGQISYAAELFNIKEDMLQ